MPLRRKITLFLFLPLALLVLVSVIYVLLVGEAILSGEDVIGCSFKHTFFLYCPGCGGSPARKIPLPGTITLLLCAPKT